MFQKQVLAQKAIQLSILVVRPNKSGKPLITVHLTSQIKLISKHFLKIIRMIRTSLKLGRSLSMIHILQIKTVTKVDLGKHRNQKAVVLLSLWLNKTKRGQNQINYTNWAKAKNKQKNQIYQFAIKKLNKKLLNFIRNSRALMLCRKSAIV